MIRRYFAYGSNLCVAQMAARCPAAREDRLVELAGWRFVINRRGVATVMPEPGARVFGLIWLLTPACEAALDLHEGVAKRTYRKERIKAGGAAALVYLAADASPGVPRDGYLERILAAAEARGLEAAYRRELASWSPPAYAPSPGIGTPMAALPGDGRRGEPWAARDKPAFRRSPAS